MSSMTIRVSTEADFEQMRNYDHHVTEETLRTCTREGRVLIGEIDGKFVGWLRWNLFWDIVPFMNLLYVLDEYQGKGYGRQLTEYWENMMKEGGHDKVMTSSAQDENAQHFYVKCGYRAIGSFMISGDPLEILFEKWFIERI